MFSLNSTTRLVDKRALQGPFDIDIESNSQITRLTALHSLNSPEPSKNQNEQTW